jgi:hypothetical protein
MDLTEDFGSATMYENVARHAWSPPNFPHTDKEAKVRYAPRNETLDGLTPVHLCGLLIVPLKAIPAFSLKKRPFATF